MEQILETLQQCLLFHELSREQIKDILVKMNYNISQYRREEVIALEDQPCTSLGVVLEGKIAVQKIFISGKVVTMTLLTTGQIFGEAIIFSRWNKYPATISALDKTRVMFIRSEDIIKTCSAYPQVLKNFMEHLSNRIIMLNGKIKTLSLDTIREKIASFLLEEYQKQRSRDIKLALSKEDLAEQMGIQRPSLSRELIKMREEDLLDFSRDKITIKDLAALEEIVVPG